MDSGKAYAVYKDNKYTIDTGFRIFTIMMFLFGYLSNYFINVWILGYLTFVTFQLKTNENDKLVESALLKKWMVFSVQICCEYVSVSIIGFKFLLLLHQIIKLIIFTFYFHDDNVFLAIHNLSIVPTLDLWKKYTTAIPEILESLLVEFRKNNDTDYSFGKFLEPYISQIKMKSS